MFRSAEWIKENPNKGTMYKAVIDCDTELKPPTNAVKSVREYIKKKGIKTVAGVYTVYCEKSNSIYIGQSINVSSRLRQHKYQLSKDCNNTKIASYDEMMKDVKLYGLDSFTFSILETVENPNITVLLQKEAETMLEFLKRGYTLYNKHVPLSNDVVFCPNRFKKTVEEFVTSLIKNECYPIHTSQESVSNT